MSPRQKVWIHRAATVICVLLAVPAILWWKHSILFVILLSLATQAYTSLGSAEAADDRPVLDRLDRIEALLEQRGADDS
jgi:membrane protein implicated in regulation of membrane protease activity